MPAQDANRPGGRRVARKAAPAPKRPDTAGNPQVSGDRAAVRRASKVRYRPAVADHTKGVKSATDDLQVPRVHNGKQTGTRTFHGADDFNAYQDRLRHKAAQRQVVRENATQDAKVADGPVPKSARPQARLAVRMLVANGNDRATAQASARHEFASKLDAKGRRRYVRKALKTNEPQIRDEARAMQAQHREARRQTARSGVYQPPEGTRAEKGVKAAATKRQTDHQAQVLREEHAKHRGGGIGQLAENAFAEAKDTIIGAPAAVKATVQAAGEQARKAFTGVAHVQGGPYAARLHVDTPVSDALVKGFKSSSPAYALLHGHVAEALGRAKERPLSAIGEASMAAGVVGKGATVARAAHQVHAGHGASVADRVHELEAARRARPALQVKDTPRQRASGKRARKQVRDDAKAQRDQARAGAGRSEPAGQTTGQRAIRRRYARNAAVRGAQKGADRVKAAAGHDPNVAGKRASKKARKRRFDQDVRNIQAGGIGLEEHAAHVVHGALKGIKKGAPQAAVELLATGRVRPGQEIADLEALRRTYASVDHAHQEHNLSVVDELLRGARSDAGRATIRSRDVRQAADRLAEHSHTQDARLAQHGYAEEGALRTARLRVGALARGEIRRRASKPQSGGEGGSSLPPRGGPTRSVMDEARAGVSAGERAGGGGGGVRRRGAIERDLKDAIAEQRQLEQRRRELRTLGKPFGRQAQEKLQQLRDHRMALEQELEARGPKENLPPSAADMAGTTTEPIRTDPRGAAQQMGRIPAGSEPLPLTPRARRARRAPDPAAAGHPPAEGGTTGSRSAASPAGKGPDTSGRDAHAGDTGWQFEDGTPVNEQTLTERYGDKAGWLDTHKPEPGADRQLRAPEAGQGMSVESLLGPLGKDRAHENTLERERRMTFSKLHAAVVHGHAYQRDGKTWSTPDERVAHAEAAKVSEATGVAHRAVKLGDEHHLLPDYLAKRLEHQLGTPSRAMKAARWATRLGIRAALPFSIGWHAGNSVDLMTRLALTTPPGTALEGRHFANALEQQLGDLSPDLRATVLSSLKGHFGSRHTVRDPRASDFLPAPIGVVTDAVGNFMKATGGRVVDKAFDVSSGMEQVLVRHAIGAEAKQYARQLGIAVDDHMRAMGELAKHLESDPAKVIELQDRVLEIVGDFATRSPSDRAITAIADPFWTWLKASTKFVLKTLPVQHPKRTALLLQAAALSADERGKAGMNYYFDREQLDRLHRELGWKPQQDGYLAGGLASGSGVVPTSPLTSFGEVGSTLADPRRLAGRAFPFIGRPISAALGYYRTPGEVFVRDLPGVPGDSSQLKIKEGDPRQRAYELGLEAVAPGAKQVRRFLEKGGRPKADSTLWHPRSVGGTTHAEGLRAIADPFRAEHVADMPLGVTDLRQREAAGKPGDVFPFTLRDGTVIYLRRTH